MRILLAHDSYYPNVDGGAYFTHRLAYYLRRQNHEVLVIAPSHRFWHNHFSEENGVPSFRLFSLPILVVDDFRFTPPFFIKRPIGKVMEEFKPDVVHVQSHFPVSKAVLDVAKKRGIPVVGTNHFNPGNISHFAPMPRWVRKKIETLAWKHFAWIYKKVDIVTTPTQRAADLLINIGFPKEVLPVSNGIDLKKFNSANRTVDVRRKYNLPNKPLLLSVSRLDKDKQIDVILRSLPGVLKKCDIHFVMVGKGMERPGLEALARKLKIDSAVTFTGFVPDEELPSFYASSDCLALACPVELQSLVTMEAMATGLPAVVANALALPELVHQGENGFLFEVGDSAGLAEGLIKIFSDDKLRKKMGRKSLEMIKKHDVENTVKNFLALYEQAKKKYE